MTPKIWVGRSAILRIDSSFLTFFKLLCVPAVAMYVDYLEDEGEQSSQAKLLTSLLPAIRKSVAEKSGMILDDDTEYKILGQSDGELRISCTTSDGKEFEIELITEGEFFAVRASFARVQVFHIQISSCSAISK